MHNNDTIQEFTAFVQQGLAQGMTRRAFLRKGMQLGLSLPTILGVLTACMSEPPRSAAPNRPGVPSAVIATPEPAQLPNATPSQTYMPIVAKPTATVTPTPQPPAPMRFAVIGDYGMAGEPEAAVAALVKSWQPEFVLTTGDNNYVEGSAATIDINIGQYYHEFIGEYKGSYGPGAEINRFFPVLGNHDWQGGTIQPYLDYFALPGNERYYAFDWGPTRFFMLDSMPGEPDGVTSDSVQAQWLKNELQTSQAVWNIVAMHHPPFSSGLHGSNPWMQWPFAEWGASMLLGGHDHDYERIMQGSFPVIINGLGGAARYTPGCCPVEGSEVFFNSDHGAMLVEMNETRLTAQFITRHGDVVDTFTLGA